jgi:hypothetical protein
MILLLGFMILGGNLTPNTAARAPEKEIAMVEFVDQVKLGKVLLKGQYWIVHDEDKMQQGEDCTYIYSVKAGESNRLVTSFHCTPVERIKVDRFTISTSPIRIADKLSEVTEIQFAGTTVAHAVPK